MDKKELKSRMDQLSGFVRKGLGIALTLRTLADLLGGRDFLRIWDREREDKEKGEDRG